MDKLIRLINEYGHTSTCGPFETYRIEPATEWYSSYLVLKRDDNGEGDWRDWHLPIPRLISKEYGFIKRLVDNDKIDLEKPKIITAKTEIVLANNSIDGPVIVKRYWLYEQLLMILSIQDSPIDFLISILR